MKILRISFLVLCSLFASSAYSIDLLESYHLALENDSELAAAKISSQADELELGIVRADIFPEIKLEAYSQRINKFSSAPVPVEKNSVGSITVSQPLWQQTLGTALELAGQQSELAKLHYEKAQADLFVKVVNAYFGALAAQDTFETTQSEIASIRTLRDHAVVRRNAGVGTETDVRIAQARLALANAAVISAQSAVETAILELSELIGHRPAELSELNDVTEVAEFQPDHMQHWVDAAVNNNIDLAIQQKLVSMSNLQIDLSSRESDFKVSLTARVNDRFNSESTVRNHTTATISISKSFSAAGRASKQRKQASLRYESELQKLQGLRARTITLASSTFRNVVSLKDQVEALQLAVDANVSALEITESNYEVGLITSLSVLDAQQDVFEVRRDLHKARYDYFQNLIALERIAGTLDIADLEALNDYLL